MGYYHQKGTLGYADGSDVQGHIAYNMGNGFSIGTKLSYDDAFSGRVSADITYCFATPEAANAPPVKGLVGAVDYRDVRVPDCLAFCFKINPDNCVFDCSSFIQL